MPAWVEARWGKVPKAREEVAEEAEAVLEVGRARGRGVAKGPVGAEEDGDDKMKVCIPTMGNGGMEEAVSQHFGRAPTFTLINLDTKEVQILPNMSNHMGGKGLPTDMLKDQGVQVMIVGGLGPKAIQFFAEQRVEVFVGATGTVKDAIEDWREQLLTNASSDNACHEHRH
jgi:predicted Fe-Mo cluster-binding NifX family protein